MMVLFLYGHEKFNIEIFAKFIHNNQHLFKFKKTSNKTELLPTTKKTLKLFFNSVYKNTELKKLNYKLIPYYQNLNDGYVLAGKVATYVLEHKKLTLEDLYRIERLHYYDNNYNKSFVPEILKEYNK